MSERTGSGESRVEVRGILERARAQGRDETVVFDLRHGTNPAAIPTPAQTGELADKVIKKAISSCGHRPTKKTVFENLGAVSVTANADLLLKILEQPEVHSALTSEPPLEPIRPVRKAAAKKEGWANLPG